MKFWNIMLLLTSTLLLTTVAGMANEVEQPVPVTVFQAIIGTDMVQRVEIVGGSYFFTPNRITLKINIPVELKLRKEPGIVPHNIVIAAPEAGIVFDTSMGNDATTIRFTPTKIGSYPFYCNKKLLFFESHREKGMKGIFEVIE